MKKYRKFQCTICKKNSIGYAKQITCSLKCREENNRRRSTRYRIKYPNRNKEYREKNRIKLKQHARFYYLEHKEEFARKRKLYYADIQKRLWRQAKRRAKNKKIFFNIKKENIFVPIECPALKIKFGFKNRYSFGNSPSLDRINSNKGYTKDNIIVVSHKVNTMKSNATIEEIEKVLNFYKNLLKK